MAVERRYLYVDPETQEKIKKCGHILHKTMKEVVRESIDFYIKTKKIEGKCNK